MNPVLAMVVPVCVVLPALPHNHLLVPHLYPIQRLHSLGALSSSLPPFLSPISPLPSHWCWPHSHILGAALTAGSTLPTRVSAWGQH